MDVECTDLPQRNITSLIGQPPPPWNQKYFDLPPKPKITKYQLPLTLAGGAHYEVVMEFTDSLLKFLVFELDRTSCLLVCVVVRNKVFQT